MGLGAVLLMMLAGRIHQLTGSELSHLLVAVFMFAAFILLVILGVMPWAGTLALKHPLHNTDGYPTDHSPEPEKEIGPYMSQGWRRKRERTVLRSIKALGLYIEPDEKS